MKPGPIFTWCMIAFAVVAVGCDRRGPWERHLDESVGNYKNDPEYQKLDAGSQVAIDAMHEAARNQAREADRQGLPFNKSIADGSYMR